MERTEAKHATQKRFCNEQTVEPNSGIRFVASPQQQQKMGARKNVALLMIADTTFPPSHSFILLRFGALFLVDTKYRYQCNNLCEMAI